MNAEALGKRIRHRRHMLNMTQGQTAQAVHISGSFYGNIERGLRIPSLETLIDLANLFQCDANALLQDNLNCFRKPQQDPNSSLRMFFHEPTVSLEPEEEEK